MTHARKIGIAAGLAALALLFVIRTEFGNQQLGPISPPGIAANNAKGVSNALHLYAEDHGVLPNSLQALLPDYISSEGKSILDNLEFLTPGANLNQLDPKTPMLRSISPIHGHVVIARADGSVEL